MRLSLNSSNFELLPYKIHNNKKKIACKIALIQYSIKGRLQSAA